MPRSQRTDPAILDRLRQARAAEDAALAGLTDGMDAAGRARQVLNALGAMDAAEVGAGHAPDPVPMRIAR
jgi:hypothetical protein